MTAMLTPSQVRTLSGSLLLLMALSSPCMAQEQMSPFTTDGCSSFPDRSLINKSDWCICCVQHDFAYWRGGSAEARLKADKELSACVRRASGDKALADLMFAGVRAGGGPYFYTSYRWGYGWAFGRGYSELTSEEAALADKLEKDYRTRHPALMCPE